MNSKAPLIPPRGKIELLSPAKDLICGMEAIRHGADAVYIGAPKFSARAAAGNSLDDIRQLCEFAHTYDARIYVALNTILKEEELKETEILIRELYQTGVDALIVQDMGITRLDIPPIPLHASTQTDNRTPEKVRFLESAGFSQVVLARELSLPEIRNIAGQTSVALEVFVHGALCVSYSGQCYLSASLSGRSANRGECAQSCRLPYTMLDADGKVIVRDKHLLSLKDMNRSGHLEDLLDAGVSSFKIEGRLKDVTYVKNITAYYRKQLDAIFARRAEYKQASAGQCTYTFEPLPEKSFNRGFTPFFLKKRTADITSFDTPKSLGEPIGHVKEIKGNSFTIAGIKQINNGDGLAFFNKRGELEGFRVNKAEDNRVFPLEMPSVQQKAAIYRNYDQAFEKLLSKPSAERTIPVRMEFLDNPFGFTLCLTDETDVRVMLTTPFEKELARKEQETNIKEQLSRLGNTPFRADEMIVSMSDNWFVPSSLLSEMRRKAVEKLILNRGIRYRRELRKPLAEEALAYPEQELTYLGNVSNSQAEAFYRQHGVESVAPAFELSPQEDVPLMFTKHCLRYSMGWCPKFHKQASLYKEPFYLLYKDTPLRLEFDCKNCRMVIYRTLNINT
ncbi:collagenase-like PrtC family protease [Parabacteroides sp. PF5-5]|uniref:peptidase U32 family protein n=1 Tax=unclassified Parabacteroides TaxID=2649774 RepID=UPI0024760F48|nr:MULTISPECIES: U32 family peptidase [unclassified Parabacteroides]MDH6305796.1 collagenase-like PrtC family protease [Parabacteroides sp. PH5-39]MDH6317767.1 collagenase-like PrtC family protease [Parabacteroides sp. PF5-13]MDH6320598.1 collagenase-like PrtC family protease [Parabacteroides sp. PH5-13]MDH6324239.1 collagenase-like PrtC family protease [Parabacteroides sp. PH5-8]MDH6328952.1 collagenase-like PrtC family protease [Parabacteroides sp. PH5-41]